MITAWSLRNCFSAEVVNNSEKQVSVLSEKWVVAIKRILSFGEDGDVFKEKRKGKIKREKHWERWNSNMKRKEKKRKVWEGRIRKNKINVGPTKEKKVLKSHLTVLMTLIRGKEKKKNEKCLRLEWWEKTTTFV